MTSSQRRGAADSVAINAAATTTRVIVASRDHAVADGFIMVNHGKRAPLARMHRSDGIVIYSPRTTYPNGDPLRAITITGTVKGAEPGPRDVVANGYRGRANLREIEPPTLDRVRDHLPTSRLRFGCFDLSPAGAAAIWRLIDGAQTYTADRGSRR